jgi:ABC-type glycerol-3-phosphate transport system permease component
MAASCMTALPIVLIFFFVQRTFLQGLGFMKNVDA